MLGFGAKHSFGIDIGTQTIKIVEMQRKRGALTLSNYVMWSDTLVEVLQEKNGQKASSAQHVAELIVQLKNRAGMVFSEAYFALPTYLAFSAVIDLPNMPDEELVQAVPLAAKQYIPIPIEDVQVDWINLGKSQKGSTQILLMAIPNTVIARYTKIARLAGIAIKGFELDVFSQIRSLDLSEGTVCVVDVGARSSTVSIINDQQLLMQTRSFDFGGNQITNMIASMKNISIEQAEALKKENGLVGDDAQTVQVLKSSLHNFVGNDVLSLIREYEQQQGSSVQEILLVGGISRMKGIQTFVQERLAEGHEKYAQIQVKGAKPNPVIQVPEALKIEFETDIWQEVSLAMGIAMRELS